MYSETHNDWGNERTVNLPAYRTLMVGGPCGVMVHVTPHGTHVCDLDCEGVCMVCNEPLEAQ